ncbi:Uncharacterised protein [Citrobacter koseri]|nr:Uncharacterised protein [Citrobacter koseri]
MTQPLLSVNNLTISTRRAKASAMFLLTCGLVKCWALSGSPVPAKPPC